MRKTMSESAVAPAFSRCRIVVMSSSSPPGGVRPRADTARVSVWLTVGGAISDAPGCSKGNLSVHGGRCRAACCKFSLRRLIRQRRTNAYELRPASVTTKADIARRRASKRPAFVDATYASKRAQVGFSRGKGLFKRTPATLPLLINHRPLHSTHSLFVLLTVVLVSRHLMSAASLDTHGPKGVRGARSICSGSFGSLAARHA